nr:glycosyltransferase family 2 protein [uncultured Cellulosilyticum sp.]
MITVFTPVYNRRYILEKCYQSLLHQTNKNFKWLIVDDGSTDQVEDLITQWIEEKKIAIHFIRQENGGKHVAHNTGVLNCDTDLFICVDSDDYLTDDAIELVYKYWDMIKNNQQLAGIAMLRKYQNGQLMSTHMPKGIDSSTLYDLYENYHFKGDLALVFRTEILKKYLFPQFENEKFVGECVVYNQISENYKMYLVDHPIYIGEYLEDGYTQNVVQLYRKNPKGYSFYLQQRIMLAKGSKQKKNAFAKYISGCWMINQMIDRKIFDNSLMFIIILPQAIYLYLKWWLKNELLQLKIIKP